MTLTRCGECGRDISDKAPSCPSCGNPIKVQVSTDLNNPIQVEPILTSKKWKKVKLVAWGVTIFGFFLTFSGEFTPDRAGFNFGFLLLFVGVIAIIVGKVGAWYADKRTR